MCRSKKEDIDEWTENIEGDLKETKSFKSEVQTLYSVSLEKM